MSFMTEQLKAEAYVRSQRPALMELSFGCEVKDTHNQQYYKVCNKSVNGDLFVSYGSLLSSQYRIAEDRIIIIGHPIRLNDWLAVLGEKHIVLIDIVTGGSTTKASVGETYITFNLTDGQPSSESDYKAFNKIVSV